MPYIHKYTQKLSPVNKRNFKAVEKLKISPSLAVYKLTHNKRHEPFNIRGSNAFKGLKFVPFEKGNLA